MKKILLACAAGTALLFATALLVTSPEPAPLREAAAPPALPATDPATDPASVAVAPAPRSTAAVPTPDPADRPPSPPARANVADLKRALEPLREQVSAGLSGLAPRIEHCGVLPGGLVITLETLDGAVRIAAAELGSVTEAPGAETEAQVLGRDEDAIRCIRGLIDGSVIAAPAARPGRRWEMPWWPGAPD
jgi:hypothetical protein